MRIWANQMSDSKFADLPTKLMLLAIVVLLATLALRPAIQPGAVQAQSSHDLFIEPGTTILRTPDGRGQAQGKVVVDLRNGEVWGFPTATSAPYPVVQTSNEPPISKPIYLGKFDFTAMRH